MKEVIVNARFLTQQVTGVQRFAIEISTVLKDKYPHEFHWVAPTGILDGNLSKFLKTEEIGRFNGHLWEQFDLINYMINQRSSHLLLNLGSTSPILYRNKITTLHDVAYLENSRWFSKKFVIWYKLIIPKTLYSSLKILTVSNFSKNEIQKYYNIESNKIEVIYNSVANSFTNIIDDVEIKSDFILAVMSISPRKNLNNILEAFKLVHNQFPSLKLIIVGGSTFRSFPKNSILDLVRNYPNIELKGHVDDEELKLYYQKAKCFVFPSLYEGFGIPPLEAAAMGCPSVVSNNSAFPEIFGNSVEYCNPLDVKSIAQSIIKIISNDSYKRRLIQEGKRNLENFDWEKSADRVYNIIKGL